MAKQNLYVTHRSDGNWNVKRPGAQRPSIVTPTQYQAEQWAKQQLRKNPDGGEVKIQNTQGKWRDSDTIGRRDPNPPKDTRF